MSSPSSPSDVFKEYTLNVDLWKHDDVMRQARNQTLLTANSALLAIMGLIVAASHEPIVQGLAAIFASAFGCIVCNIWSTIQARHLEYAKFYYAKLRSLEKHLPSSTFNEMHRAMVMHEPVALVPGEPFEIDKKGRVSSGSAEVRLPSLVLVLWAIAGLGGTGVLLAALEKTNPPRLTTPAATSASPAQP